MLLGACADSQELALWFREPDGMGLTLGRPVPLHNSPQAL
jgi:hypothetical protein